LLSLYIYLNVNIVRLWSIIKSLPEIFPDGHPLYARIYPWFFLGLYFLFQKPLYYERPLFYRMQSVISIITLLIIFPILLIGIFLRYLSIQNWPGLILLALASSLAILYSVHFLLSARRAFQANEGRKDEVAATASEESAWRSGVISISVLVVLHGVVAWSAIHGAPPSAGEGLLKTLETIVPRVLIAIKASPFANLTGVELSKKPADWDSTPSDLQLAKIPRVSLPGVSLRHADAKGIFAAGVDFAGADLTGARLDFSELQNASLTGAQLTDSSFFGAFLHRSSLEKANVTSASFREAKLTNVDFADATVTEADFDRATLSMAHFSLARLERTSFRFTDMKSVDFNSAVLQGVDFNSAGLAGSKWRNAKLTGVKFAQAILKDADFSLAILDDVVFSSADLANANFSGADLTKTKVQPSEVDRACGDSRTKLPTGFKGSIKLCPSP
jgi:uncharacterized protein YjbI with pentapeptide repeats